MVSFDIQLDHDRGIPVYRQICEAVTAALATGALEKDQQLPTIHELSNRLEVNPNTVARAYRELERDGFIVGKRGKGTFPAEGAKPLAGAKKKILRSIFDRAMAEGARNRIGADEIIKFFVEAKE